MTTALTTVAPKIAKLVPMLASDRDGEVLGAVRALGRTLKAATLISTISPPRSLAPNRTTRETPVCWRDIHPVRTPGMDLEMRASRRLTDWEQNFVASIYAQFDLSLGARSRRNKKAVIDRIICKIVAEARR